MIACCRNDALSLKRRTAAEEARGFSEAHNKVLPMKSDSLNRQLSTIVDELVRQGVTLAQARREFERQFITASIERNGGNLCRSARSLGIHRNTLRNKVNDLGIESEKPARRGGSRRFLR